MVSDLKSDLCSYDDAPATSQCVTDGQFSCKYIHIPTVVFLNYDVGTSQAIKLTLPIIFLLLGDIVDCIQANKIYRVLN